MPVCCECESQAAHVLVSYHHQPILSEGLPVYYCSLHAKHSKDLENCVVCEAAGDYVVDVAGYTEDGVAALRPIYRAGALDSEDCCSDHP